MILIIKYANNTPTLFDMLEDNGAPQVLDALFVNEVLESKFPVFNIETDYSGGVVQKKAGEIGGSFSFRMPMLSYNGDNINDFFRGGNRQYKYWIGIEIGNTIFHGVFNNSDLEFDFTITENKFEVSFLARETIEELSIYLNTLNTQFTISESQNISFETYINDFHLKYFNLNFIGDSLSTRIGVEVYLSGYNYVRGISAGTNISGLPRLETFKELYKGLGFVPYLTVNRTLESIYNDQSQWFLRSFIDINIDFIWNGSGVYNNAITISSSQIHKEKILPVSGKYIFMGYRHIISTAFPGFNEIDFTAVRGILTNGINIWQSDSIDNLNPIYAHYPFFYFHYHTGGNAPDGNIILDNQFAFYDRRYPYPEKPLIINESDVNYVDLKLYNYTSLGGSTTPGSMAYSRLFTTNSGFIPIQLFVVKQYSRYLLNAGKKVKYVKIIINPSISYNIYTPVLITDDQGESYYYISKITNLDYYRKEVELELTQI